MTVPAAISAELTDLQAAFAAAGPINAAPPLVFAKVQKKADDLVAALDVSVAATGALLDGFNPGTSALSYAAAATLAAQQANDELDVYEMRSLIGRVASNLTLGSP